MWRVGLCVVQSKSCFVSSGTKIRTTSPNTGSFRLVGGFTHTMAQGGTLSPKL